MAAVDLNRYKGASIIIFIGVFIIALVACILGINLYNAINNNNDYPANGTTQSDLDSRSSFKTFFIVVLVILIVAIGMASYWAYLHFNVGERAKAFRYMQLAQTESKIKQSSTAAL